MVQRKGFKVLASRNSEIERHPFHIIERGGEPSSLTLSPLFGQDAFD
jgi:hypothetical protein